MKAKNSQKTYELNNNNKNIKIMFTEAKNNPDWKRDPYNPTYLCMSFTHNEVLYDILICTDYYGDHVGQFLIDGNFESPVLNKYVLDFPESKHKFIKYQESSALCGIREFEKDSINYEFLFKPLGIDPTEHRCSNYRSDSAMIKKWAKEKNIKIISWYY